MDFYFQALADLKTDRNRDGLIPWSSIRTYAETYGLDLLEFEDMLGKIRSMEHAMNQQSNDKNEEEQEET